MRTDAGFTVLELLTTLAVVTILASIAVPNFTSMIHHNRAAATVNGFHTSLNYARHAAIVRNSYVVMCKSDDGVSCNHALSDWNSGWLIFDNLDRDSTAQVDAGEPILQVHGPIRKQTPIVSNRNSFTFRPMDLRSVNGTFRYCSEDGRNDRALIVNVMGRICISDTPNADTTLTCP
ncbi:MAG: GspH/FimT family pseudopilin [Gammaproteobacteria bacterium]